MADTRYLKRRHQSWYFVAAIPRALRGKFVSEGRNGSAGWPLSKIVVSLKTQSLGEAQDRRWPLVKQWRETFQRAQTGEPLSLAEIDAQAREIFTSTLERMEVDVKRRRLSINEERESLNEGLYSFLEDMGLVAPDRGEPDTPIDDLMSFDAIGHELKAVERRTGVQLEPGSKTYQLMGQAAVRALIAAAEGRLRALEGKPSEPQPTFLGAHGIDPRTLRPIVVPPRRAVRIRTDGGVELQTIASEHDATAWAQRILGAKNRLVAADARQVEDVFAAKLASFAPATATGDAPAGTSPSELVTSVDRWAPEAPEMPSRGQEVDKSHLAHPEPRRVRDKEHVRFVAKQPCLVCGRRPSDAHHLRFAQHRALGRKVSDEFTVPLCRGHHREVHRSGDEAVWWSKAGIDPLGAARTLWTQTHPLRSVAKAPNPDQSAASGIVTSDLAPVLRLPNRTRNRKSKPITGAPAQ